MKEAYCTAEMEIVYFGSMDIITTSAGETTTYWMPRENEGAPGSDGCCIWDW